MERKKIYLALAVFWTITITILSLITIGKITSFSSIENKDKYVHFTFYFVFTFLWGIGFKCSKLKSSLFVLFGAICYGIFMEIAQGVFTSSRQPDGYDVLANSVGAFIGWICLIRYFKFNKPSKIE